MLSHYFNPSDEPKWWTRPQTGSCYTSSSYCVVCVCVPGFQGAGDSSHRHHIPHRFLLLCQLCEGWHSGDAAARLLRLPSGGKPAGFHDEEENLVREKGRRKCKNVSVKCIESWIGCFEMPKTLHNGHGELDLNTAIVYFSVYARCKVTLHLRELSCAQRSIMGNG